MNPTEIEALKRALASRGWLEGVSSAPRSRGSRGLRGPNGTMWFTEEYLQQSRPAELLDLLVRRREKIARSVPAVGLEAARESYDDVVAAVDAMKELIDMLVLP